MKQANHTAMADIANETRDRIRELQQDFDNAELHADTKQLQQLIHDDFAGIGPKGFMLNKEQWINRHRQFKYEKLETSDIDIRVYDNTAIVRNMQKNKARYNNEAVELSVRASQVWINENDQWRIVAAQFSPAIEPQS